MPRERHTSQAQPARPAPDALHARAPSPSRSFPYNAPDDPSSTDQRRPTLPSFVYRQEVFELSIYAVSSIAHAHEESNRGLAISHKHTTWAKVDFLDAWRCSTRKRAGNAAIELPGIHSTRTPIRQRNPVSRQQISRCWDKNSRFRGCGARRSRDFEVQTAQRAAYPPLRRNYLKVDPPKTAFFVPKLPAPLSAEHRMPKSRRRWLARTARRHSATDSFQMNDLALRAATLSAKPSEGAEIPENAATDATPTESQVVIPEVLPMEGEATFAKKAKGIAQVAAGSALAAAGIPMLVLPGPGVAAIVGGAALVSRGNRNYTGRTATPLEERLDEAASKAADLAANTAKRTAGKAGEKAKDTALKTGAIAREAAEMAATSAPEVAKGFARGATAAAHVASGAAKSVAREAKPLFTSVKRATGAAISSAKRAEQGATKRSR